MVVAKTAGAAGRSAAAATASARAWGTIPGASADDVVAARPQLVSTMVSAPTVAAVRTPPGRLIRARIVDREAGGAVSITGGYTIRS